MDLHRKRQGHQKQMSKENEESVRGILPQAAIQAAYALGRKPLTLAPGEAGEEQGFTQDDKMVCKVVLAGRQGLVGWLAIPRGLIAATDSLGGVTRWDTENGLSIYLIPESAPYSVRQTMAAARGMPEEWGNATYPRKTERKAGKDGTRFLD